MAAIMDGIEDILDNFGLMTGNWAVASRLVIGALVAGFTITTIKPALMFTAEGSPRPWSVLSSDDETATFVPWWFVMLGGAFGFGVLI